MMTPMAGFAMVSFLCAVTSGAALAYTALLRSSPKGLPELILSNVSYGTHERHVFDLYLPAGRDHTVSKIILLVHGGRWAEGSKEKMNEYIPWLRSNFPLYAIANMNYRLGTFDSPAYPKQLDDIEAVVDFLTKYRYDYEILPEFGLFGRSSGAHMSLLYSYTRDLGNRVNAISAEVPIADLMDADYLQLEGFEKIVANLIGNVTLQQLPAALYKVSPRRFVTRKSPSTIAFYGGVDPLVPLRQGPWLESDLDEAGVFNKYYLYPAEDHSIDIPENIEHMRKKIEYFFSTYL